MRLAKLSPMTSLARAQPAQDLMVAVDGQASVCHTNAPTIKCSYFTHLLNLLKKITLLTSISLELPSPWQQLKTSSNPLPPLFCWHNYWTTS